MKVCPIFPKGSQADNDLAKHRAKDTRNAAITIEYARYYSNVPAKGE